MRRRSLSLFALVLVSGISCAQGKGVVSDPMEAEAVTAGAEAEALAMEPASEPFANMDMSMESVLAMDAAQAEADMPVADAGSPDALASDPEIAEGFAAEPMTEPTAQTEPIVEQPVEKASETKSPAAPATVSKPKKAAKPKTARVEPPKEESVPVVVKDPMVPGPEEEVVASPAPEGLIDEEVALADPEPIVSPFEEEVVVLDEQDGQVQEASTGISGFLTRHPWLAMLGLLGLLGGSIFLYWSRNRHQA